MWEMTPIVKGGERKMKRILAIGMALAFTLGIAGLSFSAEQGTMKHEDVKSCPNVNCWVTRQRPKRQDLQQRQERLQKSRRPHGKTWGRLALTARASGKGLSGIKPAEEGLRGIRSERS